VPGRIRLRIVGHRGDARFFALLAQRALMLPGVLAVSANPATCGLLLRFHGELPALLEAAAREGVFATDPTDLPAGDARPVADARLATMLFGGLAALQVLRGSLLPPAVTLAWYAANLLREADRGKE
jgi:hypothetical protein